MPSPEVEAYRDSFVNWVRFNHRDIPGAFIYVGVCAVLLALAWVDNELANHFLAIPKILPCGTINPTCALHHVSYQPRPSGNQVPTFTPPT